MCGRLIILLASLGTLAWPASFCMAAEPPGFDRAVAPLLQKHCLRCHDDKKQKGDFRLDTLARDFTDARTAQQWEEVIFRMKTGEMPPDTEPKPSAEELGSVVEWLSARSREGQAARMARRGPVAHYRLSRAEYQHTIHDLFGVHFDVNRPGVFNPDPLWHGFDRVGSMLSLSPSHVEHYLKAAREILRDVSLNRSVKTRKIQREAADLRRLDDGELGRIQARLKELGRTEPMRHLLWPGARMAGFSPVWLGPRDASGLYRARIQLSGLPGLNGERPHLMVRGGSKGAIKTVFDADVVAPEDKPVILEFETFMEMPAALTMFNESADEFDAKKRGTTSLGQAAMLAAYKEPSLMSPTGYKLFTEDGRAIYPLLLVDWIEWEGPIVSPEMQQWRTRIHPGKNASLDEIRTCLKTLAQRAWRRPVADAEMEPYVQLAAGEVKKGEKPDAACQTAMIAVLASSNFYHLQEGSPEENRSRVNDWELASRLSYFLFSSMPDEELATAADAGKLHAPQELRRQVRRMFQDPKFARFLDSYPYQWLQLHQVGMFPPNPKLYPDYSPWLQRSMVEETKLFFREMFRQNRPLREFLDSDWAMLNPRLRQHYGMPQTEEMGFQRVALSPNDQRGGLLSQASVLMLTSDGQRHRPVHRGVWLSEAIFNRTPPSPPPNVEPLEPTPTDAPKATIRMQLQAHATQATCASCHRKIDPLGFAFENYDAIGRWRTEEETSGKGKNPPVNASGELPDGRKFSGPKEFKALLVAEQGRFAEAFTEHLATYALRRVMTLDDTQQIRAIAEASKADDYRLRTVMENFVLSELFQKR